MNDENYGIIILAAGSSSRMGRSKQLLPVNGEPLIRLSINVALNSGIKNVLIVLGSNAKEHREMIGGLPIQVTYNPAWQQGMGNSLKAGVEGILRGHAKLEGVVIMVCDQPQLSAGYIKRLFDIHEETAKPIIASGYGHSVGVPAFFGNKYFPALLKLNDKQGAKQIILENPADVHVVGFPEGLIDLDTEDDYLKYIKKNQT